MVQAVNEEGSCNLFSPSAASSVVFLRSPPSPPLFFMVEFKLVK